MRSVFYFPHLRRSFNTGLWLLKKTEILYFSNLSGIAGLPEYNPDCKVPIPALAVLLPVGASIFIDFFLSG